MNYVLRKYRKQIDYDELKQIGRIALWKCLGSHDDSFGRKFTTSLYKFVDWECKKQLKQNKKNARYLNFIPEYSYLVSADSTILVEQCLSMLPEHEQEVLKQYYLKAMTTKEIATLYKCSIETARKKIKSSIAKLKEILDESTRSKKVR